MTAFRFARVALPSLALSIASLALPCTAAGLEDDVFPQDAGPATRQMEERRRANEADWFRSPAAAGPVDFPSDEIHDAVVANARAANTRAVYRRAESAMHAAVRAAVRNFEHSPELKEALAAEERAHEAFQEARREALKDVLDSPRYQAMQDLRDSLTERIADRRQGVDTLIRVRPATGSDTAPATGPSTAAIVRPVSAELVSMPLVPRDGDDVLAIAMVKLRVGADVRRMEREALADNEKVKKAREDMLAASARVNGLRDGFDRGLRDNPDFKAARESLEDARIARVTAAAYLQGADIAAGEALDFAYYLHRYDYYRYNNRDYGYGGYYRYGYPYYGASYVR